MQGFKSHRQLALEQWRCVLWSDQLCFSFWQASGQIHVCWLPGEQYLSGFTLVPSVNFVEYSVVLVFRGLKWLYLCSQHCASEDGSTVVIKGQTWPAAIFWLNATLKYCSIGTKAPKVYHVSPAPSFRVVFIKLWNWVSSDRQRFPNLLLSSSLPFLSMSLFEVLCVQRR